MRIKKIKPILIAEVGCNHMGSLETAFNMIKIAKQCNVDIVKFQKRDIKTLLTEEQYNKSYKNENSFGETYGKHREFLEFDLEQHEQLKKCCEEENIIYSSSVWDLNSANEIMSLNPKLIKIPSAQNNNYELIIHLLERFKGKIHISLGMTSYKEIETIFKLIKDHERENDVIIYACTSGYPVDFKDVCLLEIDGLSNMLYNELGVKGNIGFSGHHLGISPDIAAYTLGANYIERHFTLDRTLKGTDHAASLEPEGLKKLKRNLMSVYESLTYKQHEILEVEKPQRKKMKFKGDLKK